MVPFPPLGRCSPHEDKLVCSLFKEFGLNMSPRKLFFLSPDSFMVVGAFSETSESELSKSLRFLVAQCPLGFG